MKSTNDLLCLDRKDIFGSPVDFNIHGSEKYGVVREINIIYRPCIPRTHGDTCVIKDAHNQTQLAQQLENSKKYVGVGRLTLIMNKQVFKHEKFGDEAIENQSFIVHQQFTAETPQFANIDIKIDEVHDQGTFENLFWPKKSKLLRPHLNHN